jgi:cysteine desulfurase
MRRVYLDWNATAPLRPEARAAIAEALDAVGNPSSVHAEGRAARARVERARERVAGLVGCRPAEVVFTSGATEGARLLGNLPDGHDVFVQDTAHDCLWAHLSLGNWQRQPSGHTLAMGLANGETGIVTEPPTQLDGRWPYGGARADWLFLDIAQAAGRIPFAFGASGADFAILSGHKLGGPKGVGALIVREGVDIEPLQTGGGQELGRRSGTENVAGIAGFGAAAEAALGDLAVGRWDAVAEVRNILEEALASAAPATIFVGKGERRLPNTSCFAVPGWSGETQVMQMDLAGFAVSAGAACSSGKVRESRVLKAMGYDERTAASAIRVSLGPATTRAEIEAFAGAWARQRRRFTERAA